LLRGGTDQVNQKKVVGKVGRFNICVRQGCIAKFW
jgi:hypothetical protein